jgi:hypothetical protein
MRNKKIVDNQRLDIRSREQKEYIMSTLIPGKFSVPSSGVPEMMEGDDLEAMIARLDVKWRELKKLLRVRENSPFEEMQESQTGLSNPIQAENPRQDEDDPSKLWWDSPLRGNEAQFRVMPAETEAIIQRMEKLDQDAKIQERLANKEKQNRALTIYAIVCTLLVLFMVFSTYFLQGRYASSQSGLEQLAEPQIAATPGVSNHTTAASLAPPASPQASPEIVDSQKIPAVMSAPQEKNTPQVEYVGSRNSNKYHYRSCKWTKDIPSKNERVFHSVAEARKAGYIPCPTCRPPLTEEPQTSAR